MSQRCHLAAVSSKRGPRAHNCGAQIEGRVKEGPRSTIKHFEQPASLPRRIWHDKAKKEDEPSPAIATACGGLLYHLGRGEDVVAQHRDGGRQGDIRGGAVGLAQHTSPGHVHDVGRRAGLGSGGP